MKKKIRKKNKNRGFTLIEMIVCFALIGLFMSSVVVVLASYTDATIKNTSISQAEILANNIMDSISTELSSASNDDWSKLAENTADRPIGSILDGDTKCTVLIWGDSIYFANEERIPIQIFNNNGRLSIRYGNQKDGWNPNENSGQIDWDYGESVYMNNRITKLAFSQMANHPNVIMVELSLVNQQTEYVTNTTAYIECYNVDPEKVLKVD